MSATHENDGLRRPADRPENRSERESVGVNRRVAVIVFDGLSPHSSTQGDVYFFLFLGRLRQTLPQILHVISKNSHTVRNSSNSNAIRVDA